MVSSSIRSTFIAKSAVVNANLTGETQDHRSAHHHVCLVAVKTQFGLPLWRKRRAGVVLATGADAKNYAVYALGWINPASDVENSTWPAAQG